MKLSEIRAALARNRGRLAQIAIEKAQVHALRFSGHDTYARLTKLVLEEETVISDIIGFEVQEVEKMKPSKGYGAIRPKVVLDD